MGAAQLFRLARLRPRLERHNRWSRPRLLAYQAQQLKGLRAHVYAESPFYRQFHRGLTARPLWELPVLTRSVLMEHFDALATDRAVRLAGVQEHLAERPGEPYLGRYVVSASSGSNGPRALFLFDRSEWDMVLASYLRPAWWSGAGPALTRRTRVARFKTQLPWHGLAQVTASLSSPMVSVLSFDPTRPVADAIDELNDWRPHVLGGYASVLRALADQRLAGQLRIDPRLIVSGGEVLTQEVRARIQAAWGRVLFDHYGTSECGVLALECRAHAGLHLLEDLAIIEIVDAQGRPVPSGEPGERVLATVLFRRSQPLIRYEISDCLLPAERACACGRPFRLIDKVHGRAEEILRLPGVDGRAVPIDPLVFDAVLATVPATQWQVVHERGRLIVLFAGLAPQFDDRRISEPLGRELSARGVRVPQIGVVRVAAIPRGATGKSALIRSGLQARASARSGAYFEPNS